MDPAIDLILRATLALLFLVAAGHKLGDPGRFRATFADYRLVPEALVGPVARAVPLAEACVAALLAVPGTAALGKVGAAALLVVYGAAVAVNLARGRRHIDCGCAGPRARPTGSRSPTGGRK